MKKLVYCKACGYIFEEGKYKFCPACGVPEKMFEPYVDKIPADRRKILSLDIHPVMVHAPVALTYILLFLTIAMVAVSLLSWGALQADFAITIKILTVILPFTIVGAIITGIVDAHYRYKTTTSSALTRKKLLGTVDLLLSGGMLVVCLQAEFISELWVQGLYLVFNLGAAACTAILGLWGAALMHGIMGGPMPKKKPKGEAVPPTTPAKADTE